MYTYNLGLFADHITEQFSNFPALKYPNFIYTYGDLAKDVEKITYLLSNLGATSGDVIAIVHTKAYLSYSLQFACLSLGLPYVIIDSESPIARSQKILEKAQPKLIFFDDESSKITVEELNQLLNTNLFFLDEKNLPNPPQTWEKKRKSLTSAVDGATIAYIMFTSGSTGIPKGVAVTHQNVIHFIQWGIKFFSIEQKDIFANVSPMYFDNSVFDFYCALFSGASLAPIHKKLLSAPYDLVDHVARMQCTVWFSVPSLLIYLITMKAIQPEKLRTIRSISFGGEGYPKVELKKIYDLFAKQARLVNVYGPTECTCICSAYIITEQDFFNMDGLPPLGNINQNFDWYIEKIKNQDLSAANKNEESEEIEEGELILAGPNVSAGYYNDQKRTEAAFYTINDSKRFGKRIYKTGDIVQNNKGVLYFKGRKDNQIKHMGYRIELEEIENNLLSISNIRQAAVIYLKTQSAFGKIYAFAAYSGKLTEQQILEELKLHLPTYMIPSRLILLEDLPKNANGKIDKHALKSIILG